MKIIDLLNKIANGEALPNKIKLKCVNDINENNNTYTFNPIRETYINNMGDDFIDATNIATLLNLECEIIEEDKKIEKLDLLNTDYYAKEVYYERLSKEEITLDIQALKHWINKIIDYLMENKQ